MFLLVLIVALPAGFCVAQRRRHRASRNEGELLRQFVSRLRWEYTPKAWFTIPNGLGTFNDFLEQRLADSGCAIKHTVA